jgi:hypothetical protein
VTEVAGSQTLASESRFRLIEGWPRHAEQRRRLDLGDTVNLDVTQHLVFRLDHIIGVKEFTRQKPGGFDLLGIGIKHSQATQAFKFRFSF